MAQRAIPKPVKRTSKTKKAVLVLFAVVILAGLAGLVHHFTTTAVKTTPSGVKLAPPTTDEKKQSNQTKQAIVQQQEGQPPATTPATTKKQVSVTITSATISGIYGTVSGIVEDGGTCTATFTQGTTVISQTSAAFSNVSYVQCAPITPNLPNTNPWTVVLSYSSAAAEGSSASQALK